MDRKEVSFYNMITFSLFFLHIVNTAFALNCYQCTSAIDIDCTTNPGQEKFVADCNYNDLPPLGGSKLSTNGFHSAAKEFDESETKMMCGTLQMEFMGSKYVERLCLRQVDTCERLKAIIPEHAILDSCEICYSDFCNSSPKRII